jgi:hypothetical protein
MFLPALQLLVLCTAIVLSACLPFSGVLWVLHSLYLSSVLSKANIKPLGVLYVQGIKLANVESDLEEMVHCVVFVIPCDAVTDEEYLKKVKDVQESARSRGKSLIDTGALQSRIPPGQAHTPELLHLTLHYHVVSNRLN